MRYPEKQQVIIIAVGLIVTALFTVFRYIPIAKDNMLLKQAKAAHLDENTKVAAQIGQLPLVCEQKARLQQSIGNYDLKIPEKREFASLWEEISSLMNEHKLKDQQIKPGIETEDGRLVCIPITIECSGNTDQVFAFFRSLENVDRLLRIDSLEIQRLEGMHNAIKVNMTSKVYCRKNEQKSL